VSRSKSMMNFIPTRRGGTEEQAMPSGSHADEERKSGVAAGRDQRARDAASAMKEYRADRLAVDAKTERLRALRLARDAAAKAAPVKPKKPATKKARKIST
jgi:hypothetical protein